MSFGLTFPYLFVYLVSAAAIIFSLSQFAWLLWRPFDERKIGEVILHSRKGLFFYCLRHFSLITISSFIISSFLYQLFNVTNALGFLFGVVGGLLVSYLSLLISFIAALRGLHALIKDQNTIRAIALRSNLSIGFLAAGVFLAGTGGFYQYGHDLKALFSLGLGALFAGLISKISSGMFIQSILQGGEGNRFDRRNSALYGPFVGYLVSGTVNTVLTFLEIALSGLLAAVMLGPRLPLDTDTTFNTVMVLLALGVLVSLVASAIAAWRSPSLLTLSLERSIAAIGILFAATLVTIYHYLGLPGQFYTRGSIIALYFGILVVNLLLLLLSGLKVLGEEKSRSILLVLAGLLLFIVLSLEPAFGLPLLVMSFFSVMVLLPVMDSLRPQLQSVYELSAIIPSSRRVQNQAKMLTEEASALPMFRKMYLGLIMIALSFAAIEALSSKVLADSLGLIDTKMAAGVFIGGAGVYFLTLIISQSIVGGLNRVKEETKRLNKQVRSFRQVSVLPDYEEFSSKISLYTYRSTLLPVALPLAVVLIGGVILGTQFLSGLLLGGLLCGLIFMLKLKTDEPSSEIIGISLQSLLLITSLVSFFLESISR